MVRRSTSAGPIRDGAGQERAQSLHADPLGYSLTYEFEQPTPMIATLNVHYSRVSDLLAPDTMITSPSTPYVSYRDSFGNWCNRMVAPAGSLHIRADTVDRGPASPTRSPPALSSSRSRTCPTRGCCTCCRAGTARATSSLEIAWDLFGGDAARLGPGAGDSRWVHEHISFGYQWARPTKTAWDVFEERQGVCRDFAHLGVASAAR